MKIERRKKTDRRRMDDKMLRMKYEGWMHRAATTGDGCARWTKPLIDAWVTELIDG